VPEEGVVAQLLLGVDGVQVDEEELGVQKDSGVCLLGMRCAVESWSASALVQKRVRGRTLLLLELVKNRLEQNRELERSLPVSFGYV
jgi:hypothetical protein